MAEVQEIDPLEELRLITEAWAEAHGMEAYIVIATKQVGDVSISYQTSKGNDYTKIGLIQKLYDDASAYTQF